MNDIAKLILQMEDRLNHRLDEMQNGITAQLNRIENETKMAQQAVLETCDTIHNEVHDLNQRLNIHRQKFTLLEEDIEILKGKQ